ncbi:MAG: hypothetical protein V1659_01960 [Candidatus Woesearchaeota archaeon]
MASKTMIIRPNSQGYYADWTNSGCSSGTSEWQCVDEDPADTSDNLYTSAKNKYETFAFGNTGFSSEVINSVTLYFYGQRYTSTRYRFNPVIRSGSTNYLGSLKSLTSSYAYYTQNYPTNPATGSAWTIAQVDALEAGMKSYSSNYGGIIAQVYASVNYTIPNSCADTDGGIVRAVKGTASGYYNEVPFSYTDYCMAPGNESNSSTSVMEYYCNSGSCYNFEINCLNMTANMTGICYDGACTAP